MNPLGKAGKSIGFKIEDKGSVHYQFFVRLFFLK